MAEKYRLEFKIMGLPKSPNGSHGSWRKAAGHRKRWRTWSATIASTSRPPRPLEHCTLICIRHSSSPMDEDNIATSFKGVVDGLRDAKIIKDDSRAVIVKRTHDWKPAPAKGGFITVIVEEV